MASLLQAGSTRAAPAAVGANRTEQVGRLGALIVDRTLARGRIEIEIGYRKYIFLPSVQYLRPQVCTPLDHRSLSPFNGLAARLALGR